MTMPKKGDCYILRADQVLSGDVSNTTVAQSKLLTFVNRPEDPTVTQMMLLTEMSGTLDFWNHPDEDIYGPEDGEAL